MILLIHNGSDHWITACIDFNTLSITVYDSWKPTYDCNHPEEKTGKGKGKKKEYMLWFVISSIFSSVCLTFSAGFNSAWEKVSLHSVLQCGHAVLG